MATSYMSNQFLLAMPNRVGGAFDRTVTYICEHSHDGAMGLVINRPTEMHLPDMLEHMDIAPDSLDAGHPVFWGGPVQPERGFVLHRADHVWESTLQINNQLAVTTSRDILEAIGDGSGPREYLVLLGYAGWGSGQLEDEILANSWLNTPLDSAIIFATPTEQRWSAAGRLLGLDPDQLTGQAGHA